LGKFGISICRSSRYNRVWMSRDLGAITIRERVRANGFEIQLTLSGFVHITHTKWDHVLKVFCYLWQMKYFLAINRKLSPNQETCIHILSFLGLCTRFKRHMTSRFIWSVKMIRPFRSCSDWSLMPIANAIDYGQTSITNLIGQILMAHSPFMNYKLRSWFCFSQPTLV